MDNRKKSKDTTGHERFTPVGDVISPDAAPTDEDDHRMIVINPDTIELFNLVEITGESKEALLSQYRRAEEKGEVVTIVLLDYNKNLREGLYDERYPEHRMAKEQEENGE